VLLPGLRGDDKKLAAFRAHFSADVRFIVPDYVAWHEMVRRDASLALIIDEVIREILPQLRGPSTLVGYSFGGLIAHEAAKILLDRGHEIRFVAILDSDITHRRVSRSETVLVRRRSRRAGLTSDIGVLGMRKAVGMRAAYRIAVCMQRWRPLARLFVFHRRRLPLPADISLPLDNFMTALVREASVRVWRPRRHRIPTLIFRCKHQAANLAPDLGWDAYARVVAVEEVAGTHHSMLSGGHGRQLALALQRALQLPLA
jgi:thioesterase domain-containing protein